MRTKAAAASLVGCSLALAVLAGAVSAGLGWSFREALDSFVVSNVVIGTSFGLCGGLIAWHRPRHPVGWLYLAGGLCQTLSAAAAPLDQLVYEHGGPVWVMRVLTTLFSWAWPVHIGVTLPLSLYLVPDGRLPSRRWRPWFLLVAATAPLFVLENGTSPQQLDPIPDGVLTLPVTGAWSVLWTVSELRWVLAMLLGLAVLAIRYRNGNDVVRRQLLWVVASAGFVLVAVTPWALVAGTPAAVLFAIPMLPAGITLAILWHGLLDIRLVVARGVTYLLLSGLVLAGYALLVLALSGVASALLVALLALPLRARLQSAVERVLYGHRSDPARVAAQVGGALSDLSAGLDAVRESMRLPYVAIRHADGQVLGSSGEASHHVADLAMTDALSLSVGLRAGERRLAAIDERVLGLLAGPLSVAVAATISSRELQVARGRLVTAREEERRRLRRDLHDGLGTLLTGIALSADAAANVRDRQPVESAALLEAVRGDIRTAVAEVRRLVDDLRPFAVDELGLVPALEVRAAQTVWRADGEPLEVTVEADLFAQLPVALEVAAYRIATEALTNVVRHADASQVVIRLRVARGALEVEVLDDGIRASWGTGVGTTSMRERAEELGGTCETGPGPNGGVVRARIPWVAA